MGIRKTQTTGGQCIDVRRVDQTTITTVATYIANAKIVGEDENDVGFFGMGERLKYAQDYEGD